MKHRISRRLVVALALACVAGMGTTAPANAAPLVTETGDVQINAPTSDTATWQVNAPAAWGCRVFVTPPTVGVTCTLPTISVCVEVDVTVTALGGPGSVTGTATCAPLSATATANAPGTAAAASVGVGAPPLTCVPFPIVGTPAPWIVTCHATIIKIP